jgi:hypothetical protein
MSQVAIDTPACPAYQFGHESVAGLAMHSGTQNHLVRSEAITTTWGAVGAPTLNANVGTTYGITFGSIAGGSGDGITQTSALSAASRTVLVSFFAVALTTGVTVRITVEGDSGGTPEASSRDVVVVPINLTRPARYYHEAKAFTGSATGNVKVTITLRGTGTIFIGGIQLEDKETNGTTDQYLRIPGPYISTADAAVSYEADILTYPASNISAVNKFTFAVWLNSDWRSFGNVAAYSDMSPGLQDKLAIRVRDSGGGSIFEFGNFAGGNDINVTLNGSSFQTLYERHYERRWNQYVVTVDYEADSYKVYRNGAFVEEDTTARATPGAADTFYIGSPNGYRQWNGIIRNLKYYASVLTATQVSTLFLNEVGTFIETSFKHGWPWAPNWHDPYTVAMWDFSEASGSIVDEVNGITCTVSGSPTFNTTFTGRYADWSPGVTYTTGAAHRKLSATTQLDHNLSNTNLMLEITIQKTSTVGEQNIFTCLGHGSTSDYGYRAYFLDDLTIRLDLQADAGETKNMSWTLPASLVDGLVHKLRFHWGINTQGKLWVDEVRHATENDDDCGTVFTCTGIRIGEKYDGSGGNFIGTITGVRITQAASDASVTMTNSGGPLSLGSD